MARPPSAPGGRPHQVQVRYSDDEIRIVDAQRGSLSRSAWIRQRTISRPAPNIPAAMDAVKTATKKAAATINASQTPTEHRHVWKRNNQYMDVCDCGHTRPHELGTR